MTSENLSKMSLNKPSDDHPDFNHGVPRQCVKKVEEDCGLAQCFPTFLGLRHPTEKRSNLRHP